MVDDRTQDRTADSNPQSNRTADDDGTQNRAETELDRGVDQRTGIARGRQMFDRT